jgi:EAL domain-containing protein (putative c-di-GMP-specific phosphodiesterase class I)
VRVFDIVEALVAVAQGMGKRTVAEFVGVEDTILLLQHLGVDYAQGLRLGRPVPAGELGETRTTMR